MWTSLRSLSFFVIFLLHIHLAAGAPRGRRESLSHLSEDLLHYALHAVHPNFKDGVFASNQQALEALEQADKALALKVYSLAKRQANHTITSRTETSAPPKTSLPTTPFVTSSTSSFETVITTNGMRSTRTAFTVVVQTITPTTSSTSATDTSTGSAQLQSLGARTTTSMWVAVFIAMNFGIGVLWSYFWF